MKKQVFLFLFLFSANLIAPLCALLISENDAIELVFSTNEEEIIDSEIDIEVDKISTEMVCSSIAVESNTKNPSLKTRKDFHSDKDYSATYSPPPDKA